MKRILMIAALACTGAHAEFKDGNSLFSDMSGSHGQQMNAIGYVTGVSDALMHVVFCPPGNISAGQVYDMVRLHMERFPSSRHNSADRIISHVLRSAWPCAQRGQNL